jgi:hypothetical protein
MIDLKFAIINPFSKGWECFYNSGEKLTKNKAWEFNLYRTNDVVRFEFRFSIREDHAGLNIEVGLIGYSFEFSIYDIRHWNYESDEWEKYEHS